MANSETTRRRGAVRTAGKAKAPATRKQAPPPTAARPHTVGRGARPTSSSAPLSDRFHAVWASGQLLALVLALLCGGAIAYLLTTAQWQVQQVDLAGTTLTKPEEVVAQSGVSGHNIFTVDPQMTAERLLLLPTIREAQVWSELPNRLIVRIVERQPVLVWQFGEERYLLDANGTVVQQSPPQATMPQLPVIIVREGDTPVVGGKVEQTILQAGLTINTRAAALGLAFQTLEVVPKEGLVLVLAGPTSAPPRRILLGSTERLEEKLAVAAEIVRTDQQWTTLNVHDPDRPFFPPAPTPTPQPSARP